jgi:hypothetical protein
MEKGRVPAVRGWLKGLGARFALRTLDRHIVDRYAASAPYLRDAVDGRAFSQEAADAIFAAFPDSVPGEAEIQKHLRAWWEERRPPAEFEIPGDIRASGLTLADQQHAAYWRRRAAGCGDTVLLTAALDLMREGAPAAVCWLQRHDPLAEQIIRRRGWIVASREEREAELALDWGDRVQVARLIERTRAADAQAAGCMPHMTGLLRGLLVRWAPQHVDLLDGGDRR